MTIHRLEEPGGRGERPNRGKRYPDDVVARAKAAFALNLSRDWIARNLGCSHEITDKWKAGATKARIPRDERVYEAMARAIEQKNLATQACDEILRRALVGDLEEP